MSSSQLIAFFKESSKLTDFDIRRKIYDLTNNLDVELLYDLMNEHAAYNTSLVQKIKLDNGIEVPDIYYTSHLRGKQKTDIVQRRNKYIETHLKENEETDIEEVQNEREKISKILNDLLTRKISDLPKDSRLRNNTMYQMFYEETVEENLDLYLHNNDELQQSDEIIDLSDTTSTAKIVFLEKLGIIEFLRTKQPFNTSVNSMATVLSAITGTQASTIQSMINPMLRDDVNGKNNPMNSKKAVDTVEIKLAKIGFKF
ncbi:hypothetical protein ASF10_19245 [Flavobacterium sp. Leaf82]|uniref:hypothetical protein n=1 Tax=Flavobacterium sp. Leaf82 TaxID=1736238 RepID=UPI0006F273C4|nr:hypothetical protein [Flavobacterium sp. Leaf82]KQO33211.1 hypothetical protein ASF10_19245 [Flavobacterium sp. Leaf82]